MNTEGFLQHIRIGNWLAFVHFVIMLKDGYRWTKIKSDMTKVYGVSDLNKGGTLNAWRHLYQSVLEKAVLIKGIAIGGKKGDVVVFDETNIGLSKGIRKAPASQQRSMTRSRPVVRRRIQKRTPARTIWTKAARKTMMKKPLMKKPSAVMKKPSAVMKKPCKGPDKRRGRWLWAAVLVGNGNTVYDKENNKKEFTFKVLRDKHFAKDNKPRGGKELKSVIGDRIRKGSFTVFDKWSSSVSAIKKLGYRHAPPINHSLTWRDAATGFHSNDVESEFCRLKVWLRGRYGLLRFSTSPKDDADEDALDEGDL